MEDLPNTTDRYCDEFFIRLYFVLFVFLFIIFIFEFPISLFFHHAVFIMPFLSDPCMLIIFRTSQEGDL